MHSKIAEGVEAFLNAGYSIGKDGRVTYEKDGETQEMRIHYPQTQGVYASINMPTEDGGKKRRFFLIKDLVAYTYLGPPPEEARVKLKDGNHKNTAVTNLEYVVGPSAQSRNTESINEGSSTASSHAPKEEMEEDGVEIEGEDENLPIDHPFNPERIAISTKSPTIDLIVNRIEENEIDLDPDFQREQMWDILRKSRLIESLMLRIPIPAFYVSADEDDRWKVIDGIQRMSTITSYMHNEFSLRKLEYLRDFEGKRYDQLSRSMQRRIKETELIVNIISPSTPEEVMLNVFFRINTGGVPLNPQEVRNAFTPSRIRDYLKMLSLSDEFLRATERSISPKRMADRECILRLLAFYVEPWETYTKSSTDLNTYLTRSIRELNEVAQEGLDELAGDFKKSMDANSRIFGREAFRRKSSTNSRSAVNKALFETWGVALAHRSPDEIATLVSNSEEVKMKFGHLMDEDSEFIDAISYSTGSPKRVEKRFAAIENLVRSML